MAKITKEGDITVIDGTVRIEQAISNSPDGQERFRIYSYNESADPPKWELEGEKPSYDEALVAASALFDA